MVTSKIFLAFTNREFPNCLHLIVKPQISNRKLNNSYPRVHKYQLKDKQAMSSEKKKTKQRVRKAPYRKWQHNEERALVDFLKQNENFEKPTAQMFYRKFIEETQTDIDWPLVRGKVRNMRMCYNRAKQWSESPDASSHLNEGEAIRDVLQRMFNYYDDFDELFGSNDNGDDFTFSMEYIKEENLSDEYQTSHTAEEMSSENENEATTTFITDESNEAAVAVNGALTNAVVECTRKPHRYSFASSPPNYLAEQHKKRRFDSDDSSFSWKEEQIKFQREKLQLEREKFSQEMALKQKEIESQEKLKILELEMKERIALTEIKMKERVALQALEKKWE